MTGLEIVQHRSAVRGDRSIIYFVSMNGIEGFPIKIGRSTISGFAPRLVCLQTSMPYPLVVLTTVHGGAGQEARLHTKFSAFRLSGEWFSRAPELLDYIRQNATVLPYPKNFERGL